MNITKKSTQLISFLQNNTYIKHNKPTVKTKTILLELYSDILEAYNYLLSLKKKNKPWYSIKTKHIQSSFQISKPTSFSFNSFPKPVQSHINELAMVEISYTFSLFDRNIKVIFTLEETDAQLKIDVYNTYIEIIFIWLYVLNQYASKQCSKTLTIFLYSTSLEKHLPPSNLYILDENNANTAFTRTCPKNSEIVIYRKEEWFKVLIHETFHNFGLDFSDMDTKDCTNHILQLFPVKSEVNLYESYTEFWAEIMNACFCSFFLLKNKTNKNEFLSTCEIIIHFERLYSFFQLVKTLRFMSLTYNNLFENTVESHILRETMYKEKTNILSYYIIKTILLNNYNGFLNWCKIHNISLLQFNKTIKNLKDYCLFIEKNYKQLDMLKNVAKTEKFFNEMKSKEINKQSFLFTNMRMTVLEMG